MILSDILGHPYFEQSKQIPIKINDNMKGRVCLTNYLHSLYLVKTLMRDKCPLYLEIGTLFGGSMMTAMQCKYKTKFVGIDPFDGYYNKALDPKTKVAPTLEVAKENIERNNVHKHEFELIKGKSNDLKIVKDVHERYKIVDLLFIDGDHSEKVVKSDFLNYSDLVRIGGILIFDNYNDENWEEVKIAVSKLDLRNWDIVGEYGHSLIISRRV